MPDDNPAYVYPRGKDLWSAHDVARWRRSLHRRQAGLWKKLDQGERALLHNPVCRHRGPVLAVRGSAQGTVPSVARPPTVQPQLHDIPFDPIVTGRTVAAERKAHP